MGSWGLPLVALLVLGCSPQESRVEPVEARASVEVSAGAEPLYAVLDEVPAEQRSGTTIVLLHGFGADESDLLRLGRSLDAGASLVGLQAPLSLGGRRYAWFPRGSGYAAGATLAARPRVIASLEALETTLGHEPGRVILVGFSQGATMAVDVAVHRPDLVDAAAGIGGWLSPDLEIADVDGAPLHVFLAHGDADTVVPVERGRALRERLQESDAIALGWQEVPGMRHQIAPVVVSAMRDWLTVSVDAAPTPGSP